MEKCMGGLAPSVSLALLCCSMQCGFAHQLPHLEYPGLGREDLMAAVNRFYDSYYFRPRVIWRIVNKAAWNSHERKRLYHEAVEFLRLRTERWKYARKASPHSRAAAALEYFHLLCSVFGAKKEALAIGGGNRVKGGFSRLQQCLFRARSVAA